MQNESQIKHINMSCNLFIQKLPNKQNKPHFFFGVTYPTPNLTWTVSQLLKKQIKEELRKEKYDLGGISRSDLLGRSPLHG